MTTPVNDAMRVRVIRALLGMDSKSFAARVGVTPNCLTAWEKGRQTPTAPNRKTLARICEENGIAFLPSGMPVPFKECLQLKEAHDGSSVESAV